MCSIDLNRTILTYLVGFAKGAISRALFFCQWTNDENNNHSAFWAFSCQVVSTRELKDWCLEYFLLGDKLSAGKINYRNRIRTQNYHGYYLRFLGFMLIQTVWQNITGKAAFEVSSSNIRLNVLTKRVTSGLQFWDGVEKTQEKLHFWTI